MASGQETFQQDHERLLSRRSMLRSLCGQAVAGSLALGVLSGLAGCGGSRQRPQGISYRVQDGDTLSGIARATGIPLRDLIAANPQLRGAELRPGSRLLLPGITALPQPKVETPVRQPARLVVQPRSAWRAETLKPNHDPMNGIRRITLHHTSEHPGMVGLNDTEVINRIAHYHRNVRNWADIGYHYIIGRDGTIYQGRSVAVQGAHSGGDNNKHNLGISMVGDFMRQAPSGRQAQVVQQFLTQEMRRYRVGVHQLFGHRDLKDTLCPGDAGYAWLKKFKNGRLE